MAPLRTALIEQAQEANEAAGGALADVALLRGTVDTYAIGGVAGLAAEHWFTPGLCLRLAVDLVEDRSDESTGTGLLVEGTRVSEGVRFDPVIIDLAALRAIAADLPGSCEDVKWGADVAVSSGGALVGFVELVVFRGRL